MLKCQNVCVFFYLLFFVGRIPLNSSKGLHFPKIITAKVLVKITNLFPKNKSGHARNCISNSYLHVIKEPNWEKWQERRGVWGLVEQDGAGVQGVSGHDEVRANPVPLPQQLL
jgi:hypothetical protein